MEPERLGGDVRMSGPGNKAHEAAQPSLPDWEESYVDEVIRAAEARIAAEDTRSRRRAIQLAREQGYHRLAVEIDRPGDRRAGPGQLSFFPADPTLFDAPA
ncbi:MAG TPA: hypothetical protein VNC78_10255 [Actinomycetota bacterium]|nr:hypothetical protein [Actinomycetota bacterium]